MKKFILIIIIAISCIVVQAQPNTDTIEYDTVKVVLLMSDTSLTNKGMRLIIGDKIVPISHITYWDNAYEVLQKQYEIFHINGDHIWRHVKYLDINYCDIPKDIVIWQKILNNKP